MLLQLVDPDYHKGSTVDIIIGADYYGEILKEGLIKEPINTPTAQATIFGWILFGPSQPPQEADEVQSYQVSLDEELYKILERHWKLNEIPSLSASLLSPEEQECENHFKTTHSRDIDGRYIVKLPLKKSPKLLGHSKVIAQRFLLKLNNRLKSNSTLQKSYSEFLKQYEELQHMKSADCNTGEPQSAYYLPHHGVLRESSTSTKLRVVFNASCKTSSRFSLNDILHTDAKLQTELFDVLLWFR